MGATLTVTLGGLAALMGDRYRRLADRCLAFAYRSIVRWHPRYRITIDGVENLGGGPYILCPNHQSLSDVVYLFALPVYFKWIVKRELFWVPLFGSSMRVAGYPSIDRQSPVSAKRLLERVRGYLHAGIPVLNFPEGTRSPTGEIQKFTSGAARMAIANQVPLVPVGVYGTARLLPRGAWSYPKKAHIAITVGTPIDPASFSEHEAHKLTKLLSQAVRQAKDRAYLRVLKDGYMRDVTLWSKSNGQTSQELTNPV